MDRTPSTNPALAGLEAADRGLVGDVGVVDLEGPHVDEVGTASFDIDGPRGVVLAATP